MSKIANGILGLTAGILALGAVQLENARSSTLPAPLPQGDASLRPLYNVDRTGKSDRLGSDQFDKRRGAEASATMFVYPVAMPGMLIAARVIRKPVAPASKPVSPFKKSPLETKSGAEPKIGCEPLMSVLIVEAENVQPGRCLA